MPLNNSYDEQAVIQAIASALETFYGTLIEKIDGLNIQKVMKRKNPYLYRAKAMQSAAEIVDSVLTAFVSSSEETIFGNRKNRCHSWNPWRSTLSGMVR